MTPRRSPRSRPRSPRSLALPLTPALGLSLAVSLAASAPVGAGGTRTIEIADFDDFDAGEVDGAAIEGSGRVTVGYRPTRGEVTGASAFTCQSGGKQLYVGTADAATIQVLKHEPAKKAASKKKADDDKKAAKKAESALKLDKLAELPGVVVTAIAEGPGGDLLAATLPGGVIHRVSSKGQVSEFARLQVAQIWAIVPHKGRYLVATGPKGELYSLDSKGGDPKVILDSEEKDLLALMTVGDAILVGTSPGAKLLQVSSEPEGILLHDFAGDEIRALALTDRGLLAAVNTFSDRGISSLDALTKNLARTSLVGQPAEGSSESKQRSVKASGELFHVLLGDKRDLARASEATWESWLARDKQYFTGVLAVDGGRSALVASSYEGKIYRVRGRRDRATVADFDERQATGLCAMADGTAYATTGDGAAVYRLDTRPATQATYRSKIFDQKQPSSYGAVVVRGTGPIALRARVGPSDDPDKRWSEWKKVTLVRESDGLRGDLQLPRRRYLQLEADLEAPGAELRSLDLFYAPENLPPLVKSVELSRPEGEDDEEPAAKVTIKWKAEATDDDDLVYQVRVRPEGGSDREWIKLNGDEPVTKKELKWDLGSVPDGLYEVEVVASDEPQNGSARAERDALISAPFVVDRSRPALKGIKMSPREITGVAEDEGGYIHDVAFAIDGKPFRAASPADGLFDSKREGFVIVVPEDLDKGRHRVVLRARDSFGNLGTIAVILER